MSSEFWMSRVTARMRSGPEDRVLLENVANLLARFLAGPGRYLAPQGSGHGYGEVLGLRKNNFSFFLNSLPSVLHVA